jgi:hypothetical protein
MQSSDIYSPQDDNQIKSDIPCTIYSIIVDLQNVNSDINIEELIRNYIENNNSEQKEKAFLIRIIGDPDGLKNISDELSEENHINPHRCTFINFLSSHEILEDKFMALSNKSCQILDNSRQLFNNYVFISNDVAFLPVLEKLKSMEKHIYLITSAETEKTIRKTISDIDIATYDSYIDDYTQRARKMSRIKIWISSWKEDSFKSRVWYFLNQLIEGINIKNEHYIALYYRSPYIEYMKAEKTYIFEWVLYFDTCDPFLPAPDAGKTG